MQPQCTPNEYRKARPRAPLRRLYGGTADAPVTENGKAVGILSTRDFLAFLVEGLERYIDERKYSQEIAEGADPYDHLGGAYGK